MPIQPEESIPLEQTQPHEDDPNALLLPKDGDTDSEPDEHEWEVLQVNEAEMLQSSIWDNPLLRYTLLAFCLGLFLLMFKIVVRKYALSHEKHRTVDPLYSNGTHQFRTTVILISLDGFRPEYLERNVTPHLAQLGQKASDGMKAEYMYPCFPPTTFPNHWTLVTGLYPEAHGIVANSFYDSKLNQTFYHNKPSISEEEAWWSGEPIWVTSALQGMRTAINMWPGSTVPIKHVKANHVVRYNDSTTSMEKMDSTLAWLDMPDDERPQFMAVYIPQIDQEGHRGGPNGTHMASSLKDVDNAVAYLMHELAERHVDSHVHVVVVSDHGMTETGPTKRIYYDDILSPASLPYLRPDEEGLLLKLVPDTPTNVIQQIYEELHNYTQNTPSAHFEVYLRQEVPDRFHYRHTDRIAPIITIPEVGYMLLRRDNHETRQGDHGYDNLTPEMHAIFMAKGPKIEQWYGRGVVVAPFLNVEIYDFLSRLLNIDPAPNNGTLHGMFVIH
ncbi:hypothetical protein DFQ28_008723 [Apophysomyces sp. BC1034]|nr:hypothetical protein DFQ30_008535 [Apophysomyces sp. BC1015]KAG0185831.1 hypothetical protein DFQ28_008723 [Apophysomyces sp. BC1034]